MQETEPAKLVPAATKPAKTDLAKSTFPPRPAEVSIDRISSEAIFFLALSSLLFAAFAEHKARQQSEQQQKQRDPVVQTKKTGQIQKTGPKQPKIVGLSKLGDSTTVKHK